MMPTDRAELTVSGMWRSEVAHPLIWLLRRAVACGGVRLSMSLSKVSAGPNLPLEFHVIVEIPMNSDPIKFEIDKPSGAIFVDRFTVLLEKLTPPYRKAHDPADIESWLLEQIARFFAHCKDPEAGKSVKVGEYDSAATATQEILDGVSAYAARGHWET